MEYDRLNLMNNKNDCLKILRIIASDILRTRLVKILLIFTFIVHFAIELITSYFILYVANISEIIYYAPVYFGEIFPLIAMWLTLLNNELVHNIPGNIPLWSIDSAGEKIQKEIQRDVILITSFTVGILLIFIFGTFLLTIHSSEDAGIFFAIRFFRDFCPNYFTILSAIFRATYTVVVYSMIIHPYQCLYLTQHLKFQLRMLRKSIRSLSNIESGKDYQKKVTKRLKFFIVRYDDFLRTYLKQFDQTKWIVAQLGVGICIFGISLILYLSSENFTSEYYLKGGILCGAGLTTFFIVIWTCQTLETETNEKMIIAINEIRWYNFDKHNSVLYLIFLINAMKVRKIKFSENYSVNYQMGLAIVRNIYSLAAVMVKFRSNY